MKFSWSLYATRHPGRSMMVRTLWEQGSTVVGGKQIHSHFSVNETEIGNQKLQDLGVVLVDVHNFKAG